MIALPLLRQVISASIKPAVRQLRFGHEPTVDPQVDLATLQALREESPATWRSLNGIQLVDAIEGQSARTSAVYDPQSGEILIRNRTRGEHLPELVTHEYRHANRMRNPFRTFSWLRRLQEGTYHPHEDIEERLANAAGYARSVEQRDPQQPPLYDRQTLEAFGLANNVGTEAQTIGTGYHPYTKASPEDELWEQKFRAANDAPTLHEEHAALNNPSFFWGAAPKEPPTLGFNDQLTFGFRDDPFLSQLDPATIRQWEVEDLALRDALRSGGQTSPEYTAMAEQLNTGDLRSRRPIENDLRKSVRRLSARAPEFLLPYEELFSLSPRADPRRMLIEMLERRNTQVFGPKRLIDRLRERGNIVAGLKRGQP